MTSVQPDIRPARLDAILALREEYRREMNCQIVHDSWHARFRRRGCGSYLVQELKRICREGGHVPAARTGQDNIASQRTLGRAGMTPCGRIVTGRLAM